MAPLEIFDGFLKLAVIGGYGVLAWRLWATGLRQTYRFFFIYVIFRFVRSLILACIPTTKTMYGNIFVPTEPILWVFYVLVVLELYSVALRHYRGIASVGRWVMIVALALSVVLSVLSLGPDLAAEQPFPWLSRAFIMQRAIVGSLAIFLLLITSFFVLCPVPMSRNAIIHCVVFSVNFLSLTMIRFARNVVGPQLVIPMNYIMLVLTCITLGLWIVYLRPAGENKTVVLRYRPKPEDEARLVEQLSAINATLLRVARK